MLQDPNLPLVDVMKGTQSEIQTGGFTQIKINKAKSARLIIQITNLPTKM